jgi:hypothetical protein
MSQTYVKPVTERGGGQLTAISFQPSAISHQPSAISQSIAHLLGVRSENGKRKTEISRQQSPEDRTAGRDSGEQRSLLPRGGPLMIASSA